MHRICSSLSKAGFDVVLVGRKRTTSLPLRQMEFSQKRLTCFFNKGFLFYAEYNLRLFFLLLFSRMDGLCAIDLDTILPVLTVSGIKKIPRVYDAHEFFTEMKEVRTRPFIQKVWLAIERFSVPRFMHGYTVSEGLSNEFMKRYDRSYTVIRNLPVLKTLPETPKKERFLLSQGAVNEGRAFEYLIPAMKKIPYRLVVCGDGNFMRQLKTLVHDEGVDEKVEIKGMLPPEELWPITTSATLGMGMADGEGIHQFLALPNKFFDYIHAGLPQIAMDFPEYRKINDQFRVAVLIDTLDADRIAKVINKTMEDDQLLADMHNNCLRAREEFCWQKEEKKLVSFYKNIFDAK